MSFVRQHKGAVLLSVAIHVALVSGLAVGLRFPAPPRTPVGLVAIEAVVVDQSVLTAEVERRERAAREQQQRRQREERERREAADSARRAQEEEARQEQARLAEIQLQRERAETAERERREAERREQERVAAERREREAREREEAARREAAAREQREREAALQQQLAAEAAAKATLLDEYVRMIEARIEQSWIPPASAQAGLECQVHVVQVLTGDVVDVRVGACNGDEAVVRSIEAAVQRASPLPRPRDPSLFERNLNVTFKPEL